MRQRKKQGLEKNVSFHHFLCLCFFASLSFILFSCSPQSNPSLTFAVGGAPTELAFWESVTEDFQKQTGINVEILRQPPDTDQRRQNFLAALKSKHPDPDLFLIDVAWSAQFALSGWLEPLEDRIARGHFPKEVLFEKVLNLTGTFGGHTLALPVYVDGGLLYYRKDLLEKYDYSHPPKTWAELLMMSEKIQKEIRKEDPSFYGFVWQGAQNEGMIWNFLEFASSARGGIALNLSSRASEERGDLRSEIASSRQGGTRNDFISIIHTPENKTALQWMRDSIHQNRISPLNTFTEMKEEDTRIFFEQGHALFERNWPYAWTLHQKENSPVKGRVGITALPHFEGGESASTLGGWLVGISAYSDKKKEAWEFVQYLLSYPIQKRLALEIGWNPARRDVYEDSDVLKTLPHFKSLREVFEKTVPRPPIPYWTQISEILQRYFNAALANTLSVDQALQKSENEIQKIVSRYRS